MNLTLTILLILGDEILLVLLGELPWIVVALVCIRITWTLSKFVNRVDRFMERTDERFERIDERFERVDERFKRIDERFERLEVRLDNSERQTRSQFDGVQTQFKEAHTTLGSLSERLAYLQGELLRPLSVSGSQKKLK